jgi:hypothetical protein
MSIPSPFKQYHFHAILIWWPSPFSEATLANISEVIANPLEILLKDVKDFGDPLTNYSEGVGNFANSPYLLEGCQSF